MGTANDKCKLQKSRKVQGEPFVTRGDTPKMLELDKQSLHLIMLGVETLTQTTWTTMVTAVGNDETNVANA